MPLVRIDVLQGRPPAEKRAILDGIHAALVECFKLPEHDRNQILQEHAPENFERASGRGAAFTVVELTAFPGRSREAKRSLFQAIARNLQRSPGIEPRDVFVVIQEPPLDNWGIRGGQQASDVELGFKLDV